MVLTSVTPANTACISDLTQNPHSFVRNLFHFCQLDAFICIATHC